MNDTKIDISQKKRSQICDILNQHLANAIDLQTQCKQAHWNVRGHSFYSLHLLFDKISEDVEGYVDMIAERVGQLGGQAYGTIQSVQEHTQLAEYPADLVDSMQHVEALSNALAKFGTGVRKAVDETDDLDDEGTSDMFTEVSRGIDSWLWMVESHLHGGAQSNGVGTPKSRVRATAGKR